MSLIEFKGQRYMDIREHFTSDAGKLTPTKKGVAIPVDKITTIVNLVEQAEAQNHEFSTSS